MLSIRRTCRRHKLSLPSALAIDDDNSPVPDPLLDFIVSETCLIWHVRMMADLVTPCLGEWNAFFRILHEDLLEHPFDLSHHWFPTIIAEQHFDLLRRMICRALDVHDTRSVQMSGQSSRQGSMHAGALG